MVSCIPSGEDVIISAILTKVVVMWSIYEIIHIWTTVVDESEEWSSQLISNLSNWKEEAWTNQGFNGIRTCNLRDAVAMLYQLSYEASLPMYDFIAQWASHWYCRGHGFESRWSPEFFRLLLFQLLKLEINCDDHSSLSKVVVLINRDLKHHDGSHDDGIPEANCLFRSCAETE